MSSYLIRIIFPLTGISRAYWFVSQPSHNYIRSIWLGKSRQYRRLYFGMDSRLSVITVTSEKIVANQITRFLKLVENLHRSIIFLWNWQTFGKFWKLNKIKLKFFYGKMGFKSLNCRFQEQLDLAQVFNAVQLRATRE